jgi:GNAT superfamily N-acetyltransferase
MEIRARAAQLSDYSHFTRFFAELGVPEPPPARDQWEREHLPRSLFFHEGAALVAYAMLEKLGTLGYVRHVVVAPPARNRGIAKQVMRMLQQKLRAAGCRDVCLNVKRDNAAAIRAYEAVGMRAAYPSVSLRFAWSDLERVRDDGPPTAEGIVVAVLAEHDRTIERSFGLQPGLLAARRQRGQVRLLGLCGLSRSDPFLAFAAFDYERSGAFPFCAQQAAAARALLSALRDRAGDAESALLVIENNAALDHALRAAGAEVVLELWHYRSTL